MRSRRLMLLSLVPALLVSATLVWLGALPPGEREARKAEAATAYVRTGSEVLALRQSPVGEGSSGIASASVSADSEDDHHTWKNTSPRSENDKVQTIVNNSDTLLGGKEVSFTIENKGDSPVRVLTSILRGDFSGVVQEQLIPSGAKERVHIQIQGGQFLLASCQGIAGKKCDWTISHLIP